MLVNGISHATSLVARQTLLFLLLHNNIATISQQKQKQKCSSSSNNNYNNGDDDDDHEVVDEDHCDRALWLQLQLQLREGKFTCAFYATYQAPFTLSVDASGCLAFLSKLSIGISISCDHHSWCWCWFWSGIKISITCIVQLRNPRVKNLLQSDHHAKWFLVYEILVGFCVCVFTRKQKE